MNSTRNYIEFILDNKLQKITWQAGSNFSPTTTLLQYLRSLENHKGTKEGCAEGDCGACTVVIAEAHEDKITYKAVNSCLIFLPQIHGKQIITVENVQNENTLHPVQEALVELDASQCGFCTPGFVMSMFALYKDQRKSDETEITDAFAGNLCRCTGYQAISNAAHKALANKNPDHFSQNEPIILSQLNSVNRDSALYQTNTQKYYQPKILADALAIKNKYPDITIIGGATDIALRVTKKKALISAILDISQVAELNFIRKNQQGFEIGSATPLQVIKETIETDLPAFHDILAVFGSKQIRQVATLGGNIGSASPIGDTLPLLMAYQATVFVAGLNGEKQYPLQEFITGYRQTKLEKNEIITKIFIPIPDKTSHIDVHKISKRTDLDISTVSAALHLKLTPDNNIKNIQLYYGGMAAQTLPAKNTQDFLQGKRWSLDTLTKAGKYLEKDVSPIADARAEAEGRLLFAKNILLKFWENHQK